MFKALPKLAQNQTRINYATGDFIINVNDYAQHDILKNFVISREYHSRKNGWTFNRNFSTEKIILDSTSEVKIFLNEDRLSEILDMINRRTIYEYQDGLLIKIIYPDRSFIIYNYDQNQRLISCIDRNGEIIFKNEYDELGRLTRTKDLKGVRVFWYEDDNRRTIETPANIIYNWNRQKQIEQINYQNGNSEIFDYDGDKLIFWRDRRSNEYQFEYQGENLISETLPGDLIKNYFYDNDQLIAENDNQGHEIYYRYSSKGFLIAKDVRLSIKSWRREKFQRDALGRIIKHEVNGRITNYSYDDNSPNPTLKTTPNNYKFNYRYDPVNRLLAIQSLNTEIKFTYDPLNEVKKSIDRLLTRKN